MSHLLRRASQGDDFEDTAGEGDGEVPPSNGAVSKALGSLSGDIAKAIDQKAAAEVWERYGRGEKNAFTRRLYTLQGQATFDEIKKRYAKNSEFKKAVDSYVLDFERLLAEVTKNGAESAAGNAYLVSDPGKVYTMLAHASGRFD
jgi:hypothetical protein